MKEQTVLQAFREYWKRKREMWLLSLDTFGNACHDENDSSQVALSSTKSSTMESNITRTDGQEL